MDDKKRSVRSRIVTLRMNETEFASMVKFRQNTTERTNSNYLRKLALHKPVTFKTRNASLDEFTAELIRMRKEINFIGHNFNQVVHKLHTLDKIPEFRIWCERYEGTRAQVRQVAEQTFASMIKQVEQWSQG